MIVWSHLAVAWAWGGLLALERRAFLQAMFARPLVAATGMGWCLGDLRSGLFVGMVLELFHLGAVSLGASLPEHDTVAATATTAAAAGMAQGSGGSTPAIWSLALLLFLGVGPLGRWLERKLEGYSQHLASGAIRSADQGQLASAVRQNLWGMWPHFLVFGALTALCALAGQLLSPYVAQLPLRLLRGLAWAYPAMASVAAAIAVRGSHARRPLVYAGAAAAMVISVTAVVALRGGEHEP